ncbi:hypothetical protein OAE53_01815 [bacterium]|nr:hypothetical protein [bacterium]
MASLSEINTNATGYSEIEAPIASTPLPTWRQWNQLSSCIHDFNGINALLHT